MSHSGTTEAAPPQHRSAILDVGAHTRLWVVAAIALVLDLWSKSWAFRVLGPTEVRDVIPSVLTFRRSLNAGALFGIGQGMVPVFIVASFVALGFVIYLFASSDVNRRSLHIALSFVLAGTLGNLHDRTMITADRVVFRASASMPGWSRIGKVVNDDGKSDYIKFGAWPDGAEPRLYPRDQITATPVGVVRDFIKFEPRLFGRDVWPWVFNVADSLLVCGVAILMMNFWLERKQMAVRPTNTEAKMA